jgi:hypothetical protein
VAGVQTRVQHARRLPQESFDAVARHGISDAPPDDEANAGRGSIPAVIDITYK